MNQRERAFAFGMGSMIGLVAGVALIILEFIWKLPTSAYRARLYILLFFPGVALPFLGQAVLAAMAGTWIANWRNRWSFGGAILGAVAATALLYIGIYSYAVWFHEPDGTAAGRWVRTVGVLVAAVGVVILGRRRAAQLNTGEVSAGNTR